MQWLHPRRYAFLLALATSLLLSSTQAPARGESAHASLPAQCASIIPPIREGYGADGPYAVKQQTVKNPEWRRKSVSVFFPVGVEGKAPVIFFSHGFGQMDVETGYPKLIEHIVSRGYILVYAPYPRLGRPDRFYRILWGGFEAAVDEYGSRMDLSRVGFVGHSFGGGATPAMAYKGLVELGWGAKGALIYSMAPWYAYEIDDTRLARLPSHTKVVFQVYDQDKVNDERMALDLFNRIKVPEKEFVVLRSEDRDGCRFVADHELPGHGVSHVLKYYGVYRLFDALADYSFEGRREGAKLVFGSEGGKSAPVFMGKWPDGRPYAEAASYRAAPEPIHPESFYRNPWGDKKNARRAEGWH